MSPPLSIISVLNSARFLERLDFEATFLPVDKYGLVDPERLARAIRPETVVASIMHANTEIGTIEPISELAAICREKDVVFHTDAVASLGNTPVECRCVKCRSVESFRCFSGRP